MDTRRVLFVCTHNSARSQMAEAFLRFHGQGRFEAFSAGTEATSVRPEAVAAMAELGIDISAQESKTVERYLGEPFEWVVTVCDHARQTCPVFPGAEGSAHWSFDDPADAEGTDAERMEVFRRVRDEINARVKMFVLAGGRADVAAPEATALG
ncbi:MAG TPA: arsenate reductase ArsC [Candidatus Limnocylindria bacterium]